jgi:hypothetical protein
MRTTERNWRAYGYAGFYWIGIMMAPACFAIVLAGNTDLIYRFEHSGFPLSWMPAGVAMLSFLAAEFCHADSLISEEEESSDLAPEWEAIEA